MKALITGGAGFVGRHLTQRLLLNDWEVTVVDLVIPNSGGMHPEHWPLFDPNSYRSFNFVHQECGEYFKLFPQEHFDYVFHLAAVVGGRLTIERDPLAVATDLSIDSQFWKWTRTARPTKVVNFSSSAAYPIKFQTTTSKIMKLSENLINFEGDLGVPDLSYGWAKLTSEYLGRLAWKNYEINSVVYRPFSGYGPDQDSSYPFPSICRRAIELKGESQFPVWGTGKQSRDFIHIDDCIDGVLMTMDKVNMGQAVNLSTGISTSFIEFAELATKIVGYKPKIIGLSDKPEGVFSRVGDTTKQELLGFKSRRSLIEGIKEGIDFMLNKRV